MRGSQHATPQDCEAAFYEALEARNLERMMAVWAPDEEIICIHPSGPRLTGFDQVREGWRQIFAGGSRLSFELREQHYFQSNMLSIHVVDELISVSGEGRQVTVVATNVFVLTDRGWRMILHHASPAPEQGAEQAEVETEAEDEDAPRTLH